MIIREICHLRQWLGSFVSNIGDRPRSDYERHESRFRDPTLYRVLSFAAWLQDEDETESERRRQHLQHVLEEFRWIPSQPRDGRPRKAGVPERASLAWSSQRAWDFWTDEIVQGGWNIHHFAHGQHEELLVLIGVEQDGFFSSRLEWQELAIQQWQSHFPEPPHGLQSRIDRPDEPRPGDRPRLLGDAWLWTGEWEAEPSDGWETLGKTNYGEGRFVLLASGLLGFTPGTRSAPGARPAPPQFDLHTTIGQRTRRDEYLFGPLLVLIMSYLKADQFLRLRYHGWLWGELGKLSQELEAASEPPAMRFSIKATERDVRKLTELLYRFSQRIADLEKDVQSTEIARDVMDRVLKLCTLPDAHGTNGILLLETADLLARQMRSDLSYFRATDERGRRALDAHRTLVEVQQTKAQGRLALVVAVLGVPLSLAQIIGNDLSLGPRVAVSAFGAALVLFVAIYWWRSDREVR